jgi:hypothetical protein
MALTADTLQRRRNLPRMWWVPPATSSLCTDLLLTPLGMLVSS